MKYVPPRVTSLGRTMRRRGLLVGIRRCTRQCARVTSSKHDAECHQTWPRTIPTDGENQLKKNKKKNRFSRLSCNSAPTPIRYRVQDNQGSVRTFFFGRGVGEEQPKNIITCITIFLNRSIFFFFFNQLICSEFSFRIAFSSFILLSHFHE